MKPVWVGFWRGWCYLEYGMRVYSSAKVSTDRMYINEKAHANI